MEAESSHSKSKRKERRTIEPKGQVPEAPRLEDFAILPAPNGLELDTVDGKDGQGSNESNSLNILEVDEVPTSPSLTSDSEWVKPEDTDSINQSFEIDAEGNYVLEDDKTTPLPSEAQQSQLLTFKAPEEKVNEFETSDSDTVDPCEEAFDMPSAPVPMESAGVFYSLPEEQHLYPTLDILNEELHETGNCQLKQVQQMTSSLTINVFPQFLMHEFGPSQIESLYSNFLLESNETKVQEFLKTTKTSYDGFELYELLSNYLRASNQLAGCEGTLSDLRLRCTDYEKQLWTISSESLSETSVCDDGNQVVASHKFHVSKFNKQVYQQLDRTLKEIKELVKDSFSLYTYSVQLCKTQIKHFFHKSFKDINLQSFEVQGYTTEYPNVDLQNCASLLRLCLSTLFIFIRRPLIHQGFLRDCQQWVADCVGLLLRIATLNDHIFILNHIIRCPAGIVGKRLAKCVQIPKIPIPSEYSSSESGFGHINLDFALSVLSTILSPVTQRDEFLKYANVSVKIHGPTSDENHWVVVDSDGEDDPDDLSFFKENDLVNLIHQIPFASIFRRSLLVYKTEQGDMYDIGFSSERSVLKLIAFESQLIKVLGQGFIQYYTDRYRQLVKILGRLILHCVQYVTDHVEGFMESQDDNEGISKRDPSNLIFNEYDIFFRNSVGVLFSGKNIGTLQFLAAIPYHLISSEMLWHIYCGITKWNPMDNSNDLACADVSSEFENELVSMNESDAFYLLTTLSNMAIAREGLDSNFIRVVTLHLFQIGFLSPLTRDSCSKTARDLLGNLTRKYPQIISVLLHTINLKMQILEKLSLYLLKELAFDFWKPSDPDLKLLSHWLITFSVYSIEHQTSRFVIQSMNWHFDETGDLFLPFDIHYQITLTIMESNLKWEKSQSYLAEGMKQVSALTSRSNNDTWSWDMMKRLHLHGYDRSSLGQIKLNGILRKLPSFESNAELECVRKGVEAKNPLACLLSLYLTPVGHSVPLTLSKGFNLIEIIIQSYRMDFVIHALFYITPLFVGSLDALYSHEKFRTILTTLLSADLTYMRMAKNLIASDFPGEVTKLFGEMIYTQLNQSSRLGVSERNILRLWIECLTKLENWNKDNNVLYLLDVLAKFSFTSEECGAYFRSYFLKLHKDMPSTTQSGIVSLFNWSTPVSSLLPNASYPQMPYFLYYILSIEMELENSSGFWKSLCTALNNPKISLENAVKKSSNTKKFTTSTNYVTIYRWAQLALDLPDNHELGFLVWQKFFLRYFHRVSDQQTTHYGCVAKRFFLGIINSNFLKKIQKKIYDLLAFSRDKLKTFEKDSSSENASQNPILMAELLSDKLKLASAFVLWIDDDQLLLPSLYLPALPPQFLPGLLLSLMEGEEVTWNNYVDLESISSECRMASHYYMNTICRNCWFERNRLRRFSSPGISLSSRAEDIMKRLKSYDEVLDPPPVPVFEDVVPVASSSMFVSIESMQKGLSSHFRQLKDFSSSFSLQISQLMALNCAYWESLPDLYTNNQIEMLVNAKCSGTKNWDNCSGPARVMFKYTEARLNEGLGHQIHQNRTEYQHLMDEKGTQPPPTIVCVAAVFVEDFITNLVIHSRQVPKGNEEHERIKKVGEELFYQATSYINDEIEFYPPTRQLLSSLLEVLGSEFISIQPSQCRRLVTTCIRNPRLIGSLAPHLNLATCTPSVLIDIYRDVTNIPRKDIDLEFVILTKFDINSWLKTVKPKLNERSLLVSLIWQALADGLIPDVEKLMVHDTFRNHLRSMLLYDFPQHYGEILTYLLNGMDQHTISLNVWYDFCNGLSRDMIRFNGMDPFARKREVKRFATEGSILDHQELIETAHLLAHHFTKERLMHGLYGLYSKHRQYMEPLSCFLQMISYSVVATSLKNSRGMLSQKIVESVWPILRDIYAPWILPYNHKFMQQNCAQWIQQMNFDSSTVLQPWIGSDSSLALIIMNDFTDCVMFLVEILPGSSAIFSYLWNFYVENFAQPGVKEHVLGVVHNCLVSIPWAMFFPTFPDVELMCKVVERFLPICHSFLSVVFAQISWLEWIGSLGPKLNAKGHSMLLNLTIRLANDSVARESPTWIQVLERAESRIDWLCIPSSSLEPILNWFVMSIDSRVILKFDSTHQMDKFLLRLLKTACGYGFHEETLPQNAVDLKIKRYFFVRSYIRLIVSVASKHKNLLDQYALKFEDAIQDMLSDIVDVIRKEGQTTDAFLPSLREVTSLMTNHILMTVSRNAIINWCITNSRPPLNFLFALIHLCNSMKVHAYVTAPLLETVIRMCFQHPEARWDTISEAMTVNPEEINNFFEVTSKDGHYLLLYSLFLNRFRQLVGGGLNTISFLMEMMKFVKPKESNEEALPLLYGIIFKCLIGIHEETSPDSKELIENSLKKFLRSFAQHLILVGDDKQGWGLLGALGIGKASQLSVRGRLFAKCLGIFVLTQLPTNSSVRLQGQVAGHFADESDPNSEIKPHPDVSSSLEKLEGLKINRQYSELIECIDFAINFIKDPTNTISQVDIFILKLNGYLFIARYLIE